MFPLTLLVAVLCATTVVAYPNLKRADKPTATIDSGVVVGTTTSIPDSDTVVNQFLGIPFAEKPVRFSPPEPVKGWNESWDKPYDASIFKPACIQKFNYPEESRNQSIKAFNTPGPPAGTSEDCLNINVFTPAGEKPGSRPVLFWIFGGSFSHGSGSLPLYDGSKFAGYEDLVVVTFNYRTNIFGFPETLKLPKGKQNLGLLDQRLALDWVQRNIKTFGGDPKKITVMGESAGAGSVDALLTAPPDPVPFRAAIMHSGSAGTRLEPSGSWKNATEKAGCDKGDFDQVLQCMRDLPAMKLKEIVEKAALDFAPISDDGITLANYPRNIRLDSKDNSKAMARVPVLIGTTADEARLESFKNISLEDALRYYRPEITPLEIKLIQIMYPIGAPGIRNEYDQIATLLTEALAQCPAKFTTEEFDDVGIKTWRFIYNASFENTEIFEGSGAYHSSELYTIFGTYPEKGSTKFQKDLSREMQNAWARFVKDPSGGPGWDAVPKLAAFGDGVRPDSKEEGDKALKVKDSDDVDKRCRHLKGVWEATNPKGKDQ
ncbi:hypothetical protein NM208_g297 [Fusarium decemcellulare]|uniref:Uncharacterized protein n=1 Tax=Fusarium decemcellulare TaxID=57161 RepID=A0ACC1T082_9HYPO|nr:hypothetical protein NM208_g297 [Fusarium decemcellulare]